MEEADDFSRENSQEKLKARDDNIPSPTSLENDGVVPVTSVEDNNGEEAVSASSMSARERKPTMRFGTSEKTQEKKMMEIKSGKGVKLGELPAIAEQIGKRSGSDELMKGFHRLLFNRPGEAKKLKGHLRDFSGIEFQHPKEKEIFRGKLEKWTVAGLKELCEFLSLEKSGEKSVLIDRLIGFLEKPFATIGKRRSSSKKKRVIRALSKPATKRQGDTESSRSTISAKTAFECYVEIARALPEFNGTESSADSIEETLLKRWHAMPDEERKVYEQKLTETKKSHQEPNVSTAILVDENDDEIPLARLLAKSALPTEEVLLTYIKDLLKSADLSQITKKTIRESLAQHFNMDFSDHRQLINELIETCLSQI